MLTSYCRASLIIFFVYGISLSGTCQKKLNAGLGMSHFMNMTEGNPSSLSLDMALTYDLYPFQVELNLQHSVNTLGEKASQITYAAWTGPVVVDQLSIPESFFSRYSTAQLFINYRRKKFSGKPYLGLGIGLHRVRDRKQTILYNSRFFLSDPWNKEIFQSLSVKLSMPFQHVHFSTFLQFTNSESYGYSEMDNSVIYGTSLKLYFRSNETTKIVNKKRRLFSIQMGLSNYIPIGQFDASSTGPYISIYFPVNDTYSITLTNEFEGDGNGLDSGKRDTELIPDFDPNPGRRHTSSSISSMKTSLLKSTAYSGHTKVLYGLGIALYKIRGYGGYTRYLQEQRIEWMPGQTNFGPFMTAGLMSKVINVALEVNLPVGEIPIFIGIKTGFNININKIQKKEKGIPGEHDIIRK